MITTIRSSHLANQRPDTVFDIAWRKASREASEIAIQERKGRFPVLTGENFDAASEYQSARIDYHTRRIMAGLEPNV